MRDWDFFILQNFFFTSTTSAGFFFGVKSPTWFFVGEAGILLSPQHSPQSDCQEKASNKYILVIFHFCFTVKIILWRKHNQVSNTVKRLLPNWWGYVAFFVWWLEKYHFYLFLPVLLKFILAVQWIKFWTWILWVVLHQQIWGQRANSTWEGLGVCPTQKSLNKWKRFWCVSR